MSELPDIGKISPEIFNEVIFPRLGASSERVIVGPQNGVDVAIVEIGDKVVALTTDPVFIVPEYGWERAAWFAIHILASDLVTSGLKPCFIAIDLNLPMEMTKEQLTVVWDTMHQECEKLGISIVCGHTARYENCHYPMVGGATVLGVGEKNEYVTPKMAKAGDKIIITKGPAIEATGIFATMFPKLIGCYPGTLVSGPGFIHPYMHGDPFIMCHVNGGRGGPVIHTGQPSGVAMCKNIYRILLFLVGIPDQA